ncbi:hypothetical protein, partial [Caballeronia arationis]|uniref:hypothetical protein n=1 Tax=Caballeronia arationis TaxID=1777142 RepID=UPI001F190CC6
MSSAKSVGALRMLLSADRGGITLPRNRPAQAIAMAREVMQQEYGRRRIPAPLAEGGGSNDQDADAGRVEKAAGVLSLYSAFEQAQHCCAA